MYKKGLILVIFLLGLYVYCSHGKKVMEGFDNKRDCPNILIQKGKQIILKNTKLAEIPGVNPITFDNLEEYVEFLNWQKSQGMDCDVLYLKREYDAQGNGVYKIRPDITDPSPGSQAKSPGNIDSLDDLSVPIDKNYPFPAQLPEKQLLVDANRNDPPYNQNGYPGSKPPWGTLTAINLNTGKIIWQVPLGFYEELKNKGLITGTENFGGATATSGGLVFAGGTMDKMFRAFDSDTGKELWSYKLPFIGSAPPTSYEINNEQYIVIPASGGTTLKIYYNDIVELGDAIVAFKIKK